MEKLNLVTHALTCSTLSRIKANTNPPSICHGCFLLLLGSSSYIPPNQYTTVNAMPENTSVDAQTITVEQFHELVGAVVRNPLLTPKEANQLTFRITELLMMHNCDSRLLRLLARYLSRKAYEELVEERVIEHYCGYPLCKYRDEKKIRDIEVNPLVKSLRMPRYYNSRYCGKNHFLCSEFYKSQLGTDALFMRVNLDVPWFAHGSIENEVILLDEYLTMKDQGAIAGDLNTVIDMLRDLNVHHTDSPSASEASARDVRTETELLIKKFEEFKVIENEGLQTSSETYGEPVL
jgi:hypothetical protein